MSIDALSFGLWLRSRRVRAKYLRRSFCQRLAQVNVGKADIEVF
jgi:hypothetical protein